LKILLFPHKFNVFLLINSTLSVCTSFLSSTKKLPHLALFKKHTHCYCLTVSMYDKSTTFYIIFQSAFHRAKIKMSTESSLFSRLGTHAQIHKHVATILFLLLCFRSHLTTLPYGPEYGSCLLQNKQEHFSVW
jgi:hypothetical protein